MADLYFIIPGITIFLGEFSTCRQVLTKTYPTQSSTLTPGIKAAVKIT